MPLALFVAVAPLWSLYSGAQCIARFGAVDASIVSARVIDASRGGSEWEADARYPARGAMVQRDARVWTHADLHPGGTVRLLVAPVTGDAMDLHRLVTW